MAVLEIDGRKVEVGDDFLSLSPEQQGQIVEEIASTFKTTANKEPVPFGEGLTDTVVRGATFGLSDEVGALGSAVGAELRELVGGQDDGLSFTEKFSRARNEQSGRARQFIDENPIVGTTAEVAGSLRTAAPAKLFAGAETLGSRIAAMAKEGAIFGGLYGAGTADGDVVDALEGGVEGAVIGGTIGGAVPLGIKGAELASAPFRTAVQAVRPTANAQNRTVQALARDGVTPEKVAASVQRGLDQGVPNTIADVAGTQTQRLMRQARTIPGSGSDKINKFLNARQFDQPDRIQNIVQRTLGGDDVFKVADDLVAERSAVANELYERAFESARPVVHKPVVDFIDEAIKVNKGKIKGALTKARKLFENEADLRAFHNGKVELDDMIGAAKKANRPGQVRALMAVKEKVLKAARMSSREYDDARQVFSSMSDNIDALEAGQQFLKKDARITKAQLENMTSGEKEFFRLGASEALVQKIQTAKDGAGIVRRIFGSRAERAKLRAVFPSEKAFRQFQATMLREARTTETNQFVRGGSQTADKAAETVDAEAQNLVVDLVRGDPVSAVGRAAGTALNLAQGVTPRTAGQIADILTSTDPQVIESIMQALQRRQGVATSRGIQGEGVQRIGARALQTRAID